MERNILLTIRYDGTPFSGWQRQPNRPTVQGEIERALSVLCAASVHIHGTSRTDAGVHALGQRASFAGTFRIPTENLRRALNNLLPDSICVTSAEEKPLSFHARYDSRGKQYLYQIVNSREKDPFRRNFYYFVETELNLPAMRKAAEYLVGTHDFRCFQAAGGEERETTVRTIYDLEILAEERRSWEEHRAGREIYIRVSGDGFLYHMVRNIVGTLVEIGRGKRKPEEMAEILRSKDRRTAGPTAPACGLYLAEVYYETAEGGTYGY